MIAALLVALVCATPDTGTLTRRIEDSREAAQALQGSLDGSWRFRDGATNREVELIDPPSTPARLGGAWQNGHGMVGFVDLRRLSAGELEVRFDGEYPFGGRLTLGSDGVWRGVWNGRPVRLERRLARVRPPV